MYVWCNVTQLFHDNPSDFLYARVTETNYDKRFGDSFCDWVICYV